MKYLYILTVIVAILSTNSHATIPMTTPPYVILENFINTQKQAYSQCINKAHNKKNKNECHIIIEDIKAIEKRNQQHKQ